VPGSGLGLSIARAIMTAHGGSLEVSSRVDEGTTFTAVMPAAVEVAVAV
jgi:signal transduction histidine kinase